MFCIIYFFTSCHRYGLCAATSFLWYRKFIRKIPLWGERLISALLCYSQDCSLINQELSLRARDLPADAGSSLEALNFRISGGYWHACLHLLSGRMHFSIVVGQFDHKLQSLFFSTAIFSIFNLSKWGQGIFHVAVIPEAKMGTLQCHQDK